MATIYQAYFHNTHLFSRTLDDLNKFSSSQKTNLLEKNQVQIFVEKEIGEFRLFFTHILLISSKRNIRKCSLYANYCSNYENLSIQKFLDSMWTRFLESMDNGRITL